MYGWDLGCLVLFSLLFIVTTHHGLLQTYDSHAYAQLGIQMAKCQCLVPIHEGSPYWPPFYPLVVAIFGQKLIFVHYLLSVVTLILWIDIGKKLIHQKAGQMIFSFLLSTSLPLFLTSVFQWSEIVAHTAFVLTLLISFDIIQKVEANTGKLIQLWFFVVLILLTRNTGIFLVFGIALGVVWRFWGEREKWKLFPILLVFALAFVPFVGWHVWNESHLGWQDMNETYGLEDSPPMAWIVLDDLSAYWKPAGVFTWIGRGITAVFLSIATGYFIFKKGTDPILAFLSIILLAYVSVWLMVPVDQYEITRYLSPVTPIVLCVSISFIELVWPRACAWYYWLKIIFYIFGATYNLGRLAIHIDRWTGHKVSNQIPWIKKQ